MPRCSSTTQNVATLAMIYAGACVVYLVLTRPLGTPFRDSLTEAQQRIKRDSVRARRDAFLAGLAISAMVVLCVRPFSVN